LVGCGVLHKPTNCGRQRGGGKQFGLVWQQVGAAPAKGRPSAPSSSQRGESCKRELAASASAALALAEGKFTRAQPLASGRRRTKAHLSDWS